ncbi:hypothetical protein SAVIM40S_08122 [Streptomyces avidinii]
MRQLSETAPVVLAVDDVQHGDQESLRQLLHLARHCRTAPLLMVFTQPVAGGRQDVAFGGELLRQPNFMRVRLPQLGRGGVQEVLAEAWPGRLDAKVVDRYYALSGGNPLLLRALVEDHRAHTGTGTGRPAAEPQAGQVFRDALLACLERGGERSRQVAIGLAVLGEFVNRELLAQLLDLGREQLTESLHALGESGIIRDYSFRSRIARDAVLDALEPELRVELHLRSADLLHACGAPPYVTAEHLLQAGRADKVWGVGVLQEAAEQVLLDDHVQEAVSYLELAHSACEDPRRRIEIRIRLALIARRISAAAAELHLLEVLERLRVCPMPAATVESFAELLLAHGWLDQAREVIDCAVADDRATEDAIAPGGEICAPWESVREPGFCARRSGRRAGDPRRPPAAGRGPSEFEDRLFAAMCRADPRPARRGQAVGRRAARGADAASLRCLLYLVRRLRTAPLMMVLCESTGPQMLPPAFHAELLRHPQARQLRLLPLSRDGIAGVIEHHVDTVEAPDLVADFHAVSGGNPLLVHALLADSRDARRLDPQQPSKAVASTAFTKAALAWAYRDEAELFDVAAGVAVLGESATPSLVACLVGRGADVVDQVMTALDTAGLLENGTLRDAAVGKAILEHVDAVAKADLRRRAARLLHDDGAPATVVAQHLLAASVTEPWAGRTLLDAAYRSMEAGHEEMSLDCLRLAGQSACTERDRAAVLMARVKIGWQIDPRMVAPWLDALVDTLRAGHLKGADAAWTVKYLAWHGQFDEAGEALVALSEGPYAEDPRVEDELHVVRHWLRHTVPALDGGTVSGGPRRPPRRGLQPRQVSPSSYALELLGTVMAEGPDEHALAMAEEILRGCRSSTTGVEALEAALLTLVYGDRPDRALFWCDVLLQQAGSHVRGTVAAILAGIRAEVALHQGALPVAEQYARDALSAISHSGWGVAIGSPLSALVLAATASGKSGLAGAWLNHDVPVGMFETRHGLLYTHARGHYHLAVDRPAAALDDFLTCGELAKKWGADTPTFLPWRSSAAQAHLALGNPTQARALVREQLGRPGGSTPGTWCRTAADGGVE